MIKMLSKFLLLTVLITSSIDVLASENTQKSETNGNLKIGERLYYGLVSLGSKANACASCHTYYTNDSINWNPSVLEMAKVAADMDLATFKSSLLKPDGDLREKVHVNYELSDSQLNDLHSYLTQLAADGIPEQGATHTTIILFILTGLLILAALIDLLFTKRIKYKAIHLVIIIAGLGYHGNVIYTQTRELGRSQNYQPDQPIKFSHKVHAGNNKIDCLYCHYNAEDGKSAGIPSAGLCMNCHTVVRNGPKSGKFEINKIVDHFENQKDIEWVRIHNLPDHVFFSHAQHVNVGKLDCTECHGQVAEMDILKQQNELSMGWCLDCHRTRAVDFENNGYYKTFKNYHKDLQEGKKDSILAVDIGATDCMKCHY